MLRYLFLLCGVLCLGGVTDLSGQQFHTKSKKALRYYDEATAFIKRRQYPEAAEVLREALEKDEGFVEARYRLASCYRIMGMPRQSIDQYQRVIEQFPDLPKLSGAYLALAELHMDQGNYREAEKHISQFIASGPDGEVLANARKLQANVRFALEAMKNPLSFRTRPMPPPLNQFPLQYFPVLTADEQMIVYTKRNGDGPLDDEDLFVSIKNDQGDWLPPASLSSHINTSTNEGTCTISADGRTLVFTSCMRRDGFGSCDLYISYREGQEWSVPENMGAPVNTGAWESQPTLSADARTLYFVSNRPGGPGGRDIWKTVKNNDGSWTVPEPLPEPVNTPEEEVSPYLHPDGTTLYFASSGHVGMGGFDMFLTTKETTGWSAPENLGYPLNNQGDQVSLFIATNGENGYYSEEIYRQGQHFSVLMQFDVPEEILQPNRSNYVKGRVLEEGTDQPLGALLTLVDLETNQSLTEVNSDPVTGEYLIVITEGKQYGLFVNKKGYLFTSKTFDYLEAQPEPLEIDLYLSAIEEGSSTTLQNIFFDVDSYSLRETSKAELENVSRFLHKNKNVRIEIIGHTDNQGSAAYNRQLSKQRAESVYNYLITRGIPAKVMQYKGAGMQEPIATNETPEGRQMNRRIEFKIVEK